MHKPTHKRQNYSKIIIEFDRPIREKSHDGRLFLLVCRAPTVLEVIESRIRIGERVGTIERDVSRIFFEKIQI